MIHEDVTNFFTNNHNVWFVAARLKLHLTTSVSYVNDRGRVSVVRPVNNFASTYGTGSVTSNFSTPNASLEEGVSPTNFTVNHHLFNEVVRALGANVKHSVFVCKHLLIKVITQPTNFRKVAVIREAHTYTVRFCTRCGELNVTMAQTFTAILIELVGLFIDGDSTKDFIRYEVSHFLSIRNGQVSQRYVKVYLRWCQHRHSFIFLLIGFTPKRCRLG